MSSARYWRSELLQPVEWDAVFCYVLLGCVQYCFHQVCPHPKRGGDFRSGMRALTTDPVTQPQDFFFNGRQGPQGRGEAVRAFRRFRCGVGVCHIYRIVTLRPGSPKPPEPIALSSPESG